MCKFVGFVNYKQDISKLKNILIDMNKALSRHSTNEKNYYISNRVALAKSEKKDRVFFFEKKDPVPFVYMVKSIIQKNYKKH